MENSDDQIIEDYIERVLELRQQSPSLQQADLESLALELGMTADDIDAAKRKAQAHLTRGEGYLRYERWDDAIDELKQANVLNPVDLPVLHRLAQAYQSRYEEKRQATDKAEVIALSKQCLAIQPNDLESIERMNALEPTSTKTTKTGWLIGAGMGFAVMALVVGTQVMSRFNHPSPVSIPEIEIPLSSDTGALENGETTGNTPLANAGSTNTGSVEPELDIPIEFEVPGLAIEPRLSRLNNYTDSSFYKLEGVLVNNSEQELVALRLKVDYLDAQGNIIATDSDDALSDSDAKLRPGDVHAVNLIEEINPNLSRVRLTVTTQDQTPAANAYEPAPEVDYIWGFTQPANLDFSIAARSDQFKNYSSSAYHDAVFEVTNIGDVAIERLKLQIDFYDVQDQLIGSEDILVVYGDDSPMLPSEIRPKRSIHSVPETYASYRITVLEAQ